MSRYGNENAAAGGRNRDTAGRDASYGGGGGFGGGGSGGGGFGNRTASVVGNRFGAPSASAQAAAATRNAPTNAPYAGQGGLNARRAANPTPSYDMSLHNMFELSKMMPGVGMPARVGMTIAGYGPDFQGYRGQVNGPGDYDGPNRFGSNINPAMQGLGMSQAPMAQQQQMFKPSVPQQPMSYQGPQQFGYKPFQGMQGSQWTRPGYSFRGPGQ